MQFDKNESELLFNTVLFPLKRQVNQKLYLLFEQIKLRLKDTNQHKQFIFPEGTDSQTGKISQGENYLSYPWVMLDFPKLFNKDEIFAFRTMFWYGHYFSCSMLLSGNCAAYYLPQILKNRNLLTGTAIYISMHVDPWQHEVNDAFCVPQEMLTDAEIVSFVEEKGFIKMTGKFTSTNPAEIEKKVLEKYKILLEVLGSADSDH